MWIDSNGELYAGDCTPGDREATEEEIAEYESRKRKQARILTLKSQLCAIDQQRIRPLAEGDTEYLSSLNAQVLLLREELRSLL